MAGKGGILDRSRRRRLEKENRRVEVGEKALERREVIRMKK